MTTGYTDRFGFTTVREAVPSVNDWASTFWNWYKLDEVLYQAAVGHKHSGEAAINNPTGTLELTLNDNGGTISPGSYWFCVTWVDSNGLETAKSTAIQAVIGSSSLPDTPVYSSKSNHSDGLTAPNTYYYRTAYRKNTGESLPSNPLAVELTGTSKQQIVFTFTAIEDLLEDIDSIVVYRRNGTTGSYVQLAIITTVGQGSYTDDNSGIAVCDKTYASVNTLDSFHSVEIDWSALNYTEAEQIRIYSNTVDLWTGTSLLVTEIDLLATPVTSYTWTGTAKTTGKPPTITQCLASPSKIDLATEVTGELSLDNLAFTWKDPIDTYTNLPTGEPGDARVVIDEFSIYVMDDSATPVWVKVSGSGGGITHITLPDELGYDMSTAPEDPNSFDSKILPLLPSSPNTGEVVIVTSEERDYYGVYDNIVYLYVWRGDWATPVWQLINPVFPTAPANGYDYTSVPIGTMFLEEKELEPGTYVLKIMQVGGGWQELLTADNVSDATGYYGVHENSWGEYVPAYGYGATRFNWDSKKVEYYDDTIATPAWVEVI
jgi:hypothetical protein